MRTCVGCGERAPKPALRRFVADRDALRLDPSQRAPGRGGYLHPDPACVRRFVRAKGPIRSLRRTPAAGERQRLAAVLDGTTADPK